MTYRSSLQKSRRMTKSLNLPQIKSGSGAGYRGLPQFKIYGEGSQQWRIGVRDGNFVRDEALTATGFFGAEDIDWITRYEES